MITACVPGRGQSVVQVTLVHPQEADRAFSRRLTEALRGRRGCPEPLSRQITKCLAPEPRSSMILMTPEKGILVHRLSTFHLFWLNLGM